MRTRRLALCAALVALTPVMLSGCATEYFAKTNDGQKQLDAALAEAGLSGPVAGEYSCTGALPLTATNCYTKLTITTDDPTVFTQAAAMPFLGTQRGDWSARFQGTEFASGSVDDVWPALANVPALAQALPPDSAITRVSVGTEPMTAAITADGLSDFSALCHLATESAHAGIAASVSSRTGRSTDLAVNTEAASQPGFDAACGVARSAVDALGTSSSYNVIVSMTKKGGKPSDGVAVTVYSIERDVESRIETWAAGTTVPDGVDLDAR